MDTKKKSIEVAYQGKTARVAIYPGTAAEGIEKAVSAALGLAPNAKLLLRDSDGDAVALSDSLPDGLKLTLALADESAMPAAAVTPPGPKPYPIVGNLPSLTGGNFIASLSQLVRDYGEFVRLKLPVGNVYVCSDADIVSDMLTRTEDFQKMTLGDRSPLGHLRTYGAAGGGLFTSEDREEIWHVAHRILLPTMGANALKQYFPRILEVADQLISHLAALPAEQPFLCTDLMTRMTFESIAYAGFDKRFNCIENTETIPFVEAMVDVLKDAMSAPTNILPPTFHPLAVAKRERAVAILQGTVDTIIKERRQTLERGEAVPNDILQTMLTTRDRTTGQRLPDSNIRAQLLTFLIAGHETTSGLLSYALYFICKNPEVLARMLTEIDAVFGRDYSRQPTYQDVDRLEYTLRVLKETLRLCPTAPGFNKTVMRDTVVAGKYAVAKGHRILTFLPALHRDPRYWGNDAERFDPDRFLPAAEAARHPDAYHPFGIGMRSCIGFQFALVEAKLVLARMLQHFRLRIADPNYQLEHVLTLTTKPKTLYLILEKRPEEKGKLPVITATAPSPVVMVADRQDSPPLLVLYGSNMGTCQDLAQVVARQAQKQGFSSTVAELDSYVGKLPQDRPLIIVTSTYNGTPPDNAIKFAAWLEDKSLGADSLRGVRYAVLGCGNKQWRSTFQKFPRFVHERLAQLGAEPFFALGLCDADADFDAAAEAWQKAIWPAVSEKFASTKRAPITTDDDEATSLYTVELANFAGSQARAVLPHKYPLHENVQLGVVTRNIELQSPTSDRSTRHIEIELPEGTHYTAGDHLGVFPENPHDLVDAVARRCGVRTTDVVVLGDAATAGQGADAAHLPTGVPITVHDLLSYHVDLAGPVTRKELRAMAAACPCPPEKAQLLSMAGADAFKSQVLDAKLSFLDILSRFQSVECSLGLLLSLRPLLKPRYYSISSSPQLLSRACTVTIGVHSYDGPDGERRDGVCSHYLSRCNAGSTVRMFVRDTGSSFRLPADPSREVILIGPGTGLAPLRGFILDRAAARAAGKQVGKTYLYFGCRRESIDYLYREELEKQQQSGDLAGLYLAFSREPEKPRVYVQDRLREHAAEVAEVIANGGSILVCGDARMMAPDVQRALIEILATQHKLSPTDAEAKVEALKTEGRYLQDVWAS